MDTARNSDGLIESLSWLPGFIAILLLVMLVPEVVPKEFPLAVVWGFAAIFGTEAIFYFIWGSCQRASRSHCWNTAFWPAVWGGELAAVACIAAPAIRTFGALRLLYFLTGFYLQVSGITQLAADKRRAVKDLAVGLLGMLFALVLKS